MSKKTNLLIRVVELSLVSSRRCMSSYSHCKSPHKFTQPQLMTCLILRAYLKTTYRGVIELLDASETLCEKLGLEQLPHYSTLKRFADRSDVAAITDAMLADILRRVGAVGKEVALDSTGMETTSASAYYRSRTGRSRQKYVKVSAAVTCGSILPAAVTTSWGPRNDKTEARALLAGITAKMRPKRLYADAGYDAEWIHEYCRGWGVRSWIPPVMHRPDGTVNGYWRSQMTPLPRSYGRRWHVESFFSGLKRTTGAALTARTDTALFREALLRVLAYAIRR